MHQGWLGKRDHVLHAGEGPIHVVRWAANYIAWANDVSVKVCLLFAQFSFGFLYNELCYFCRKFCSYLIVLFVD